ncbi:hypothetical protein HF086_002652 [Spodoptera exigua]|uniref:Transposase n=1 Tax=Spodoptera exigua TaxID=7107 RepID=A0A922SKP4_SPOEX|nr:hypothetical protein HF086_002652 [Spodoptera exigua]
MSQHKNLSRVERNSIINLRDSGLNISEISRELNMSRNTVKLWLRRFDSEGSLERMPRMPQPTILTQERVQRMVSIFEQHPFTSTRLLAEEFECTAQTIRNGLRRAGIKNRKPAKKISLTEAHKAARVRFARDYRDFDFSHVIFTGEKSFQSSQIGRRYLWRVNNTRYEPRNVLPNNESGHVVVNMWAWMSAAGPGELVYIPGRATGATYLELLQDTMLPTVRVVYPEAEHPEITFIQDNCPIQRSRIVQQWIDQQPNLRTVPWPSRSPDLNPVENLWAIMVQRWDPRSERTKEALVAHVDEVWESLRGSDLCESLVKSMRSRCDAVIDAGGALTKY